MSAGKKSYDIDKLPTLEDTDETFQVKVDEVFYDDETHKIRVDFISSGNNEIALDWINKLVQRMQGKYRARLRGV